MSLYTESMVLINRDHPQIKKRIQGGRPKFMSVLRDATIYFTKSAEEDFGVSPGKYIHFFHTGKRWYFYVNDDLKGFPVFRDNQNASRGVRIINVALVEMIRSDFNFVRGARFRIKSTGSYSKGYELFEIIFLKTVKKRTRK